MLRPKVRKVKDAETQTDCSLMSRTLYVSGAGGCYHMSEKCVRDRARTKIRELEPCTLCVG